MKWIATIANFLFPGLGYLIAGQKAGLAVGWLIGAVGLTYVEFGIRQPEPTLYWIMFASVFLINLMFAIDVNRSYQARSQVPAG